MRTKRRISILLLRDRSPMAARSRERILSDNMAESAKVQHEKDQAALEAQKKKSAEDNKEFVEFLHTKGLKAKFHLVIENIKKGAAESRKKTAEQIAKSKELASAHQRSSAPVGSCSAQAIQDEFNAFLKEKGLGDKYEVVVAEV